MAKLNVNGAVRDFEAEGDTPLLWVLREQLGLTGTKYGCGIAACGACTVHIDGVPTRSCVRPVSTVGANEKIVTIEGLSPDGSHPVQKAWVALDVPQCGYCQCGMVMTATALLRDKFNANEILVSLMLVYVAQLFLDWLVRGPWRNPGGMNFPETRTFAADAILPEMIASGRTHWGFAFAIIAAILVWFMMRYTLKGFEISVLGQSERAGRFAGFSSRRMIWFS
eukprot:gene245-336_t